MRPHTHMSVALSLIVLLLTLAGCATAIEELKPVHNPPNLIGKWKGEWTGLPVVHPIEMVVDKQEQGKLSGTMTIVHVIFPTLTHRISGIIGAKQDGSTWILLDVGAGTFSLKVISERRLEGTGESSEHNFRHYGPATLNRE